MKELSIEEKAKRYDKAIEIINDYYQKIKYSSLSNASTDREVLESAFSELKESKDEMIRKALIDYFRWNPNSQLLNEFTNREVFAWLERQGEPNYCHHKVDLSDCSEEYRKAYYDGWNNCNQQHAQLEAERRPFSDLITWKYVVDAVLTAKDGIGQYLDNPLVEDIAKKLQDRFGAVEPIKWRQDNVEELTDFENAMMHIAGSFFGENAGLDPNDTDSIREQANYLIELAQDCNKKNETKLDKIMAIADSMPRATLKLSPTDHAVSRDLERRIKAATRIVDKEFADKELDKAAVDFYLKHIQGNRYSIDSTGTSLVKEMAKFGAEWQKEQMSKNAIPGTILVNRYGNKYVEGWSGLVQYNEFEQNDKVKILIFKEE